MSDIDFNPEAPLEAERDRKTVAELEAMLLEALETPAQPLTHHEFNEIRCDGLRILEEHRARRAT